MYTSVIGYPRIGSNRELKFLTEDYFKENITEAQLQENAKHLRNEQWKHQYASGISLIPSNDFTFYDCMLDTAVLLGATPKRYSDLGLSSLDTYFAMARGYQGKAGDVKALPMRKWFNTNYHYIVPELSEDIHFCLSGSKPFDEFVEAKAQGILTKPVLIGPLTFLKLSTYTGGKDFSTLADELTNAYKELLLRFNELGAEWIQFDEPILVTDLDEKDITLLKQLYTPLLKQKRSIKLLLQTYFGDIRDCYKEVTGLDFDGIGLDFIEGNANLSLVAEHGFPKDKVLFAGVVCGRNIWRNHYENTLQTLAALQKAAPQLAVSTSCSLLHVPYTVEKELQLPEGIRKYLAFAMEKLKELAELEILIQDEDYTGNPLFTKNAKLHSQRPDRNDKDVQERIKLLSDKDFVRTPSLQERELLQKEVLRLPLLPTTTIGSFPQTREVKTIRSQYKKGELSFSEYQNKLQALIADCISLQEELGLDVLVHGEYERNDMVEFFGENLSGFLFTTQGWVQSYGTRCVKPPIIWGDVKRVSPITVELSKYAQSLTVKPVKGMLTGPVTILNWSFPREDISLSEIALQIALAIRDEVLDLEASGLSIIQVDEAALKEKLPLRRADWHTGYLDWAIKAFRLVHSGVKARTQIHTHMCYSEFSDILTDIDSMDADVISFEASRSSLTILNAIKSSHFQTAAGPGVYDIHSPRIPSTDEIVIAIHTLLQNIPAEKLWINPDCGLKTRGVEETVPSLRHMVEAAKQVRKELLERFN